MTDRAAAFAAIDAANDADPSFVEWDGRLVPKARLQGERATYWLSRLAPDAPVAVELAARAHHLRRFAIPRSKYPEGRLGYRRWRAAQNDAVASELTQVLRPLGVDPLTLARIVELTQRAGLGRDPQTQLVEDAACLVFCETDLAELVERIGPEKTAQAIRKTLPKMSAAALALAPEATPAGALRALLVSVASTA